MNPKNKTFSKESRKKIILCSIHSILQSTCIKFYKSKVTFPYSKTLLLIFYLKLSRKTLFLICIINHYQVSIHGECLIRYNTGTNSKTAVLFPCPCKHFLLLTLKCFILFCDTHFILQNILCAYQLCKKRT